MHARTREEEEEVNKAKQTLDTHALLLLPTTRLAFLHILRLNTELIQLSMIIFSIFIFFFEKTFCLYVLSLYARTLVGIFGVMARNPCSTVSTCTHEEEKKKRKKESRYRQRQRLITERKDQKHRLKFPGVFSYCMYEGAYRSSPTQSVCMPTAPTITSQI